MVFAHSNEQNAEDLNDMIDNMKYFTNGECDFIINHPNINHSKVRTRHYIGNLNSSNFIYGAFVEMVRSITEEELTKFNHFCLVSANQYFINNIHFEPNINYFQFYNSPDWEKSYKGKHTERTTNNFLQQPYGKWDSEDMFKIFGIENPMASNWECGTMTPETMMLCKENIDKSLEIYPNNDLISVFPGFMALLSLQEWDWPPFFGTFDPSCSQKNKIITNEQIDQKYNEGYFSVKRVNYSKDCPIKDYIRSKYMGNHA